MFTEFWAADYSGSATVTGQRSAIRLAGVDLEGRPLIKSTERFTRDLLRRQLFDVLQRATDAGDRCLVGIDHQFSFSRGLPEALTGASWDAWRQLPRLLAEGGAGLPAIVEEPSSNARHWIEMANVRLAEVAPGVQKGPFWSPSVDGSRSWPAHTFVASRIAPTRLVETLHRGLKPVFRVGGPGAVGLQSLCGIPHLSRLLADCQAAGVPLHPWPFDGWQVLSDHHAILEIYPGLFNRGAKSHDEDAWESARWMAMEDRAGRLDSWLCPVVSPHVDAIARLEGWVLGIGGDG